MTDQQLAAKWAFDLLKRPFCLVDTETTGLSPIDQVCQIGVLFSDGSPLLNSLVRPTINIPAAASAIHGITGDRVAHAHSFDTLLIPLLKAIGPLEIVIYNSSYDLKIIRSSLLTHGIDIQIPFTDDPRVRTWINGKPIHCAMLWYSQFVGDWNPHHGNYKWQKLPNGDHSAIGDCKATLAVIRKMADSYQPT